MPQHSTLAPSSAERRMACPGSRALEAKYPQPLSPAAEEGTAAHWVLSELLNKKLMTHVGTLASNGVMITDEMVHGAMVAEAFIRSLVAPPLHEGIEETLDISFIHPECWGTCDYWCLDMKREHLHVVDYKFGHLVVEPFENWQLIAYSAGVLHIPSIVAKTIHLHIVQPRAYHPTGKSIRTWTIEFPQLQIYWDKLRRAEMFSMQPNAPLKPSPQCQFCSARSRCDALQRRVLSHLDSDVYSSDHELTPEELGNELRMLLRAQAVLNSRITGLQQQALALIKQGQRVNWFRAEATRGREKWKKSVDEIITLGELWGLKLAKSPECITPKQAVDAGLPRDIMTEYSETQSGEIKLVEDKV